jgi:hypothetical protein
MNGPDDFMSRFRVAMSFLAEVEKDRGLLVELSDADRIELLRLCGAISLPNRGDKKKLNKAFRKEEKGKRQEHDKAILAQTGLRVSQAHGGITTPVTQAFYVRPPIIDEQPLIEEKKEDGVAEAKEEENLRENVLLHKKRSCYCCGVRFNEVHHFYSSMCGVCGDFNYAKRLQTCDLTGRIALVTGGRVKIGFHIVLKLLRSNCRVIVVTRFARDAVVRYSKEPDFSKWSTNLQVRM